MKGILFALKRLFEKKCKLEPGKTYKIIWTGNADLIFGQYVNGFWKNIVIQSDDEITIDKNIKGLTFHLATGKLDSLIFAEEKE
jgi:hypothetical protein